MRYLGLVVLIYAFISISGMVFIALLLTSFYIKKKVSKMDEAKWDLYFKSMNTTSYLIRFWIVYLISLFVVSIIEYYVLTAFGFHKGMLFSMLTIILGIIKMIFKFKDNMNVVLEKINKIKNLS